MLAGSRGDGRLGRLRTLAWMFVRVLFARIYSMFTNRVEMLKTRKVVTFVNTSIVGGAENKLLNSHIGVEM